MIAALDYDGRTRELKALAKGLNPVLRDYLFKGEHLTPPPYKPVGSGYQGELTEEDNRRIQKLREGRYNQIKLNLEVLCLELGLNGNECEKSTQYAVEALGI